MSSQTTFKYDARAFFVVSLKAEWFFLKSIEKQLLEVLLIIGVFEPVGPERLGPVGGQFLLEGGHLDPPLVILDRRIVLLVVLGERDAVMLHGDPLLLGLRRNLLLVDLPPVVALAHRGGRPGRVGPALVRLGSLA